ncbi:MAG: peptide deformylase [Deltaproteobacteria bacterium]|nr:peptide deformylase [Deltaproteobacteria bacterium]
MSLLNIRIYPDSVLTTPAEPVDVVDDGIRKTLEDIAETMYAGSGIGLAAPQVGISLRLMTVDVPSGEDDDEGSGLLYMINPRIVEKAGSVVFSEGCLSFPGLEIDVARSAGVKVEYTDMEGLPAFIEADGLLAICLQHEIDHLDGIVFVDRLGTVRRKLALREFNKLKQRAAEG